MATNLGSLSNFTNTATGLGNLILVTPEDKGYQPQNKNNPNGPTAKKFLFNFEEEQSIELQSDITDHFTEDNSAIQDQISLKPEIFTTTGFIGELNDVIPEELKPLKIAAEKAVVLAPYTPELTVTALQALEAGLQTYRLASNNLVQSVSSWSTINGGGDLIIEGNETPEELDAKRREVKAQNKQQLAYQEFYGYWKSRTLFTVQTPWAIFKNMAIQSLRAIQDAETRSITSFNITFKVMRFASTSRTTTLEEVKFSERIKNQMNTPQQSFKNASSSGETFSYLPLPVA